MPRQVNKTVYKYAELSDRAKQKARGWWAELEASSGDHSYAECATDELQRFGKMLGIEIAKRGSELRVCWDTNPIGASFTSKWRARNVDIAQLLDDVPASTAEHKMPQNDLLRSIALSIQAIAQRYPDAHGATDAGRDSHHMTASVDLSADHDDETHTRAEWAEIEREEDDTRERMEGYLMELAGWYATEVNAAYEYSYSDEAIAESIEANECEFNSDGSAYHE